MSEPITISEDGTSVTSNPMHQAALQRLAQLEASLLARDPQMPMHLKEIHRVMIEHEELVHLLTDEEIAIIINANAVHSNNVFIASTKTKSGKTANSKAAGKITLDQL